MVHTRSACQNDSLNTDGSAEKKADPGVPNSFVHKDKVLAEMAAEKRAVSPVYSIPACAIADMTGGRSQDREETSVQSPRKGTYPRPRGGRDTGNSIDPVCQCPVS